MENSTEFLKIIFEIRKEIGKMSKDKTNPFHDSRYFDINDLIEKVDPLLQKHNLLLMQPVTDGKVWTKIVHLESGEILSSWLELSGDTNPQKKGSEITYYRRYTLQSLLAIQAEDDDANKAAGATPRTSATNGTDSNGKPTKWLDMTHKDGTPTKQWQNLEEAIAEQRVTSLKEVRAKYKVNKATEAELIKLGLS